MLQQWWNDPNYRTRLLFVVAALLFVVFVATLLREGSSQTAAVVEATSSPTAAASTSPSPIASASPTSVPATPQPTTAPAPTAQPPAAPPLPAGNFRNGTFSVGVDVAPGTYRTRTPSTGCVWARLNAQGQVLGGATTDGPEIVTILPTDRTFRSSNCATWSLDLSPLGNSNIGPHIDGTYFVGADMAPGVWKASSAGCVWSRVSGFTGDAGAVIASGKTTAANQTFEIGATDRGFRTANCGILTRAG